LASFCRIVSATKTSPHITSPIKIAVLRSTLKSQMQTAPVTAPQVMAPMNLRSVDIAYPLSLEGTAGYFRCHSLWGLAAALRLQENGRNHKWEEKS